jgi:hypothetical protein
MLAIVTGFSVRPTSAKLVFAAMWVAAGGLAGCDEGPAAGNPYLGQWEALTAGQYTSCPLAGAPVAASAALWAASLTVRPMDTSETGFEQVVLEDADGASPLAGSRLPVDRPMAFRINPCAATLLRDEPCRDDRPAGSPLSSLAVCAKEGTLVLLEPDRMLVRITGQALVRPAGSTATTEPQACGWSAVAVLRKRAPAGAPLGDYRDPSCGHAAF